MDINTRNLLNEYMDVLFRITVADHWFNALGNKSKCNTDSREYIDLCNLFDRMVPLYISLRELNINPPRWINDNLKIDQLIEEYKINNKEVM
ncbi:hypothetical protein [Romboutsia lituseburensis]|uniref:hypothetical protein n=1 Tax=Romboutsia lituseburensis TaxID=1537 RepID=UPI00215ABAB6|nr:hypothetical protein [Romboutsia lituseburensis]MCR8746215.1 hypothetical protein [Romboutsia lituseburensis]